MAKRRRNCTEQQARSIRILMLEWGCTESYLAHISGLTLREIREICHDPH